MKTKIGLPLGLALVMFIGIFTTMLALGVMSPSKAQAVTPGFPVDLSDASVGAQSNWTFSPSSALDFEAGDTMTIEFLAGFNVGGTGVTAGANWTVAGVAVAATGVVVSNQAVTLTAGTITTVGGSTAAAPTSIPVTFTAPTPPVATGAEGIVNPTTGFTRDSLTAELSVITSAEADADTAAGAAAGTSAGISAPFTTFGDTTVDNLTVIQDPISPGAAARYQIKFTTAYELSEGIDEIILEIDSAVGVPTSLGLQDVRISASLVTNVDSSPGQNRPLEDAPRYQVLTGTDNRKEYKISIPDMDASPERNSGIKAGADVTLTLLANAGFTNPTEAGKDDFTVSTSRQTKGVKETFTTPVVLFSDDKSDNRNKPLTVSGKGFKDGTSVTVYLDKNKDGKKNTGDVDLVTVTVASDDTFEATFNVTVPPFEPLPNKNVINATDGEAPPNTLEWDVEAANDPDELTEDESAERLKIATDAGAPSFEVEGLITVSPKTLGIGDTLNIDIKDWPNHDISTVNAYLSIGGIGHTADLKNAPGSISNNRAQFEVDIKNNVRLGTQQVEFGTCTLPIAADGSCPGKSEVDNTTVVISGADLVVRPDTIVANQTITVTGRGFSDGATINAQGDDSIVTFGGSDLKELDGPRSRQINDNETVDVDNGGNWSASIVIPVTNSSVSPGPHELKVIDSKTREGVAIVSVAPRTLTLEPQESRVGTRVTITGTGFPARNTEGESVRSVSVDYNVGSDRQWEQVGSVSPDGSGNFSLSFLVPTDAGIPSTNSVRAVFDYGFGDVITLTTHTVPEGTITLSKSEASAGETVTITGQGFKAFRSVDIIEIGEAEITPSPKPLTTGNGEFSASFVVPGLDPGIKNVKAVIDETTASAPLVIVLESEAPMMPGMMPNEAMAPAMAFAAVIAEDNLITVYHFDPATQSEAPNRGWTLYDARPLFMGGNNLDMVNPGGFYFVEVSENQMGVTLGGRTMDLYAGLNPIVW